MAYKETEISGSKWQRASRIIIENPAGGVPSATFFQERVSLVDGRYINEAMGQISEEFIDPLLEFELLDPNTLVGTGTMVNYGTLYAMILSLYVHLDTIQSSETNV